MQIVRDDVSAGARVQAEEQGSAQAVEQPRFDHSDESRRPSEQGCARFQAEVWLFADLINVGREERAALGCVP